ncbi:MAG: 3-deoxy-7-phosphoheptulonate synthase [Gammaproteobacteria bacterium RIFCSPHIGHO2_12_FULL_45_9]|nr:MAG: 3-deoxy-7-phosphoheptulonate synthase [Gammaproteobacteria bacterium RIFCSPHIGHO2_12_FULL_45_9]
MSSIDNLRITSLKALAPPALIADELPITPEATQTISTARLAASRILQGKDDRLLVVVGPCSIHDPQAALEYAAWLQECRTRYHDTLHLIMRVYFEKPRTTVGWKGLINDPTLDGNFNINKGLYLARELLLSLNNEGVPTGSEFLDTTIPQYIADLTSWSAIGARTTESQIHRELASGLSMPVGFKNSTTGQIDVAVDAVFAAHHPHHFLGVSKQGVAAIVSTAGNPDTHIILRGSKAATNYDAEAIAESCRLLSHHHLPPYIMVDCSHGNSRKDYTQQRVVADALAQQMEAGSRAIMGVMIESNLVAGNQALSPQQPLRYGQSITDACVDLPETDNIFKRLETAVLTRRASPHETK